MSNIFEKPSFKQLLVKIRNQRDGLIYHGNHVGWCKVIKYMYTGRERISDVIIEDKDGNTYNMKVNDYRWEYYQAYLKNVKI